MNISEVIDRLLEIEEQLDRAEKVDVKLPQCSDEDENGNTKFQWNADISEIALEKDDQNNTIILIY
jgi:hypothetical protein